MPDIERHNGRTNGATAERILVTVRDPGDDSRGHASLIADVDEAQQLVSALVEAGVAPDSVSALRATELPLSVAYRWDIKILDEAASGTKARVRPETQTKQPPLAQLWANEVQTAKSARSGVANRTEGGPFAQVARLLHDVVPDSPFQFRLDRMVWMALWTVSLLVLSLSVASSLSKGSAREFVIESPPTSYEGGALPAEKAAFSEPTAEGTNLAVGGASLEPSCVADGINLCRCDDFSTQPEAQAFFEGHPPGPGHNVDPNADGVLCEWLPVIAPTVAP
jgi:hypothetical protein